MKLYWYLPSTNTNDALKYKGKSLVDKLMTYRNSVLANIGGSDEVYSQNVPSTRLSSSICKELTVMFIRLCNITSTAILRL